MLRSIKGVEIFAAGKWNGDSYSESDLDEMVRAFAENKETLKPSLKLGHDPNQKLLQKDGFPAAGWISNVYRQGAKLIADFVDIPEKIYDLIAKKAYRKVSSEIFWNIEINGKPYKRALSAVALLGGDMPAVGCLDDMLALYGVKNADKLALCTQDVSGRLLKEYTFDAEAEGGSMPTEKELALEKELNEQKEAALAAQAKAEASEAEAAALKEFKKEAEAKLAAFAASEADAKLEKTLSDLEKDGAISPSMRPYAKALLGPETKEYSIGEKKLDKTEVVRELLKLHSEISKVSTTERTSEGDKVSSGESAADSAIREYAAKNKVSYGEAYRAVMKNQKKEG